MEDFLIEIEELNGMIDGLMDQWAACDINDVAELRLVLVSCQLVITMTEKVIEDHEAKLDEMSMSKLLEFADVILFVKDEIYDKLLAVNTKH